MRTVEEIYVNGGWITPNGTAYSDLINPATNEVIGKVRLGNEEDTRNAIRFARLAFTSFSKTNKQQRISYLRGMVAAVERRKDELTNIMVEEYGGTLQFCRMSTANAISSIATAIETLEEIELLRNVGKSKVRMEPVGVVGIITPWNASNSFICSKLSMAIAAGCTAVIKPSELSALQTQLLVECLHEAGLPAGVFNVVNGLGSVVGEEITRSADVSKISFTGSTAVGKAIAKGAVDTMKRVTLELGGKSPNIILEDADMRTAIPLAVTAGFMNSGQACIAGTRILVPQNRLEEVKSLLKEAVGKIKTGNPAHEDTGIGPMVSRKQYDRVQRYIKLGEEEGAEVLIGGMGHPENLNEGNFVNPTIFVNVNNKMRIAREEIFGPVLSVITYNTEEEAIEIANDTDYGLQAYVSSSSIDRANAVAAQINAGRVLINGLNHDPKAPFGGFKQSGIGREFGTYGLEEYLEPKTIII